MKNISTLRQGEQTYPAPDGPITAVVQFFGTSPQTFSRSLRSGESPFAAYKLRFEKIRENMMNMIGILLGTFAFTFSA